MAEGVFYNRHLSMVGGGREGEPCGFRCRLCKVTVTLGPGEVYGTDEFAWRARRFASEHSRCAEGEVPEGGVRSL